jgi:hypothetical protein
MEATMTLPAEALPKKKIKTGTVVAIAGGTVVLVGGFFVFVYKDKDGNTLWQKWTNKDSSSGDKAIEDVATPTDAPPAGVKWVAENSSNPFPLKKGMFGGYTKNLQKALGLKADGKFGSGTEAKVKSKWNKTTVDRADYNSLVNPVASGGGSNFSSLIQSLGTAGKNDKDGVVVIMQGANKNYMFKFWASNGRMGVSPQQNQKWKMGTYVDGGKKIYMDGVGTYSRSSAILNMADIVKYMDGGAPPMSSEVPYWANK